MVNNKNHFSNLKFKKSFTLIEVITVILIFLVIGSLFLVRYFNISTEYSYFKNDIEIIKEVLIKAQQKALLGENNNYWGVYFQNATSDNFYLFMGNSFSTSGIFEKYSLSKYSQFVIPSEGQSLELIFIKFTGYLGTTSQIVLKSFNNQLKATITINYFGNVDYEIQ
jgi:type II secretory pathway pseudopilin PulG